MKADSTTLTRWVKRLALPVLVIACVVFFRTFWFAVVPPGMDTMPDTFPAGTICVIERDPESLKVGSVVFVEVQTGKAPIIARVRRLGEARVHLEIDNPASRFAGYADRAYPRDRVRGLVLSRFDTGADRPDRNLPEVPRGR